EGVWIAPVTAQVMMTFRLVAILPTPLFLAADVACRPPLVRDERHQPAVTPARPLAQACPRQPVAAVGLDRIDRFAAPGHDVLLRLPESLVQPLVARDIVAHAARRVQVERLVRSHER